MKIKIAINYRGDGLLMTDHGITPETAELIREDLQINPQCFTHTPGLYEFDLLIEGQDVDYANSKIIRLVG